MRTEDTQVYASRIPMRGVNVHYLIFTAIQGTMQTESLPCYLTCHSIMAIDDSSWIISLGLGMTGEPWPSKYDHAPDKN